MSTTPIDPWNILKIPPTSDKNAIRQAYLTLARLNHPDQFRHDPLQYRQQEEKMKTINEAYRLAISGQAPSRPEPVPKRPTQPYRPPAPPPPPPVCALHKRASTRICRTCQTNICTGCEGFVDGLCAPHFKKIKLRERRARAVKEWVPFISLIAILKLASFSSMMILWLVLGYFAILGYGQLRRARLLGCLAFLLFPYSLVLAGIYSLYQSLSQWNDAAIRQKD